MTITLLENIQQQIEDNKTYATQGITGYLSNTQ